MLGYKTAIANKLKHAFNRLIKRLTGQKRRVLLLSTIVLLSGFTSSRGNTAIVTNPAIKLSNPQLGCSSSTTTSTTTTAAPTTTTTLPIPAPTPGESGTYALIEENGGIVTFGGARYFGSLVNEHLNPHVIGGGATKSGKGYWLVNSSGKVFAFGNAKVFPSKMHLSKVPKRVSPVTSFTSTDNDKGYWLLKGNGGVSNFGNASFCGSAVHEHNVGRAVAMAADQTGTGYWIATASGHIFAFGTASSYGNALLPPKDPLVAIAPTPDGKGYVLLTKDGNVLNFGDANFYGSPAHSHIRQPFVGIAETPDGKGYWVSTSSGRVLDYGDAKFWGSLTHVKINSHSKVVALINDLITAPANVNIPRGLFGYDISNFQCKSKESHARSPRLPSLLGVAVIEAAGWLDSAYNSCIQSEVAWARKNAKFRLEPYSLYIFLNAPGNSRKAMALERAGPAGFCTTLHPLSVQLSCQAYNYGYNGTKNIFRFAKKRHVASKLWWLDIENDFLSNSVHSDFRQGNYWSKSTALNAQVIQGALDALRQQHVTVGIYSTSIQYDDITGGYAPSGPRTPLWVAGVPWTSPPYTESYLPKPGILTRWCKGDAYYNKPHVTELFAGGKPVLLQETPGNETSPFGLDPDFTC